MEEQLQEQYANLDGRDKRTLFFILVSVFISAWVLTKEPAEIYGGYIVIFTLLPIFIGRFGIPTRFWAVTLFLLFAGAVNIALGNDTIDQFLKIFIGVILSYLFYYYALQRFDFDVTLVFRYYLKGAWFATIVGVVQFVSYIVRFKPGYDFRWLPIFNKWSVILGGNLGLRVNSFFGEPSTYAAVLAPAMFVAVYNLFNRKEYFFKTWQSAVVLAVYVLTFSSLGYIGIFVAILLLMFNFGFARIILLFIPLFGIAFYILYFTVPDFQYRLDSLVNLYQTGQVDIRTQHGSSIVFYNNFVVATENLKINFLFGTGLGSHPVAFEKYSLTKDIQTFGFANNSTDANSMLLRIISEIGLIGVIAAFLFIKRGYVKRDESDPDQTYWIISAATLCIIVLYLLRQGHYFLNGFPFFVWMYYYARKKADEYYANKAEMMEADYEGDDEGDEDHDVEKTDKVLT